MQVKMKAMESATEDFKAAKRMLSDNAVQLSGIMSSYGDISCVKKYFTQIRSVKNETATVASRCENYATALNSIEASYKRCEKQIVDWSEGIQEQILNDPLPEIQNIIDIASIVGAVSEAATPFGGGVRCPPQGNPIIHDVKSVLESVLETTTSDGDEEFMPELTDMLEKIISTLGQVKTVSEYGEYVLDSELLSIIKDKAKEWGDIEFFKKFTLIDDCHDFIDAWQNGDGNKVESILESYIKKTVKKATGLSGVVNSTYINLGWNGGKRAAENIQEFIKDPSLVTLTSGVIDTIGGAYFDTGADLAEKGMKLLYGIIGKDFDSNDFGQAMDYLGNMILHPIETFTSGEVNWEQVAKDTVDNVVTAVNDVYTSVVSFIGGLF